MLQKFVLNSFSVNISQKLLQCNICLRTTKNSSTQSNASHFILESIKHLHTIFSDHDVKLHNKHKVPGTVQVCQK